MSAVAVERRPGTAPVAHPETDHSAQRLFEPAGLTLEDLILGAWEDLAGGGPAECPVCGGALERSGCTGCDSSLS